MSGGRFDVWVRPLGGPGAGQEQRGKGAGNVVELGKSPPPGGIVLPLRALAPVHARVQLSEGRAVIVPVGSNPVRLAPHANVDWDRVDPLHQPTWWNPGGVIYLGRPGSGVALELVRVEALGAWEQGRTTSAVSAGAPVRIRPSRLPLALVGCGIVGVAGAIGVALAVLAVIWQPQLEVIPRSGPVVYDFAEIEGSRIVSSKSALMDLEGAWDLLQVRPSAAAAEALGESMGARRERDHWDERAFLHFVASAEKHASSLDFYRRVEDVHARYARVLAAVDKAGLPQAIAAIPFTESRYQPQAQSVVCAKGWWQFMPEVALRHGLRVEDCRLHKPSGEPYLWTPTGKVPPRKGQAPYLDRSTGELSCGMAPTDGCAVDERTDLDASTAAAVRSLSEAWTDQDLARSGAGAVLTILSHNAGYLDARFGVRRPHNIRPAFKRWSTTQPESERHHFYGANLTCKGGQADLTETCDGELISQTQHYGYTVLAQHLVAMCYLGRHHGEDPAFVGWADRALRIDGVCSRFRVPSPGELR